MTDPQSVLRTVCRVIEAELKPVCATARQRAEAFLRTLDKWKE